MDDLSKRIRAANSKVYNKMKQEAMKESKAEGEAQLETPKDFYQESYNKAYEDSKKDYPRGASASVIYNVRAALYGADNKGGIAPQYKSAKAQVDGLKNRGDIARSRIARDQYMRDVFLPVIEALVDVCGVDELLNASKAIDEIDKFAMVEGGSSKGYTASYIRTLHRDSIGSAPSQSDSSVLAGIRDIKDMIVAGNIRSAIGFAGRLIRRINDGEHIASNEDYELIQKVASRGE